MQLNENILKLEQNYLFAEIALRVRHFREAHPEAEILSLGINDVTRPLAPAVSAAMADAAREMQDAGRFHGYGDVQGEPFLREAIAAYYRSFHVSIGAEDVFVSDGAKSDLANLSHCSYRSSLICFLNASAPNTN